MLMNVYCIHKIVNRMTIFYVNGTGEPNIYGFREDSDDDWKCDKSSRKLIVSKYIFDQNKFSIKHNSKICE